MAMLVSGSVYQSLNSCNYLPLIFFLPGTVKLAWHYQFGMTLSISHHYCSCALISGDIMRSNLTTGWAAFSPLLLASSMRLTKEKAYTKNTAVTCNMYYMLLQIYLY